MMDSLIWVFWFVVIGSELYLLYINYLARVRYKKYFVELTPVWRWFDKKGKTHIALLLGFLITFIISLLVGPIGELHIILGFITGAVSTNAIMDSDVFCRRYLCIKFQCPKLEKVRKCTECELQEQYNVLPFSLTIEKKSEVGWRQKYIHLIGFFKWIINIILRRQKSGE